MWIAWRSRSTPAPPKPGIEPYTTTRSVLLYLKNHFHCALFHHDASVRRGGGGDWSFRGLLPNPKRAEARGRGRCGPRVRGFWKSRCVYCAAMIVFCSSCRACARARCCLVLSGFSGRSVTTKGSPFSARRLPGTGLVRRLTQRPSGARELCAAHGTSGEAGWQEQVWLPSGRRIQVGLEGCCYQDIWAGHERCMGR